MIKNNYNYQEKLLNSRFSKNFNRLLLLGVEVSSQKIFMVRGEKNAQNAS